MSTTPRGIRNHNPGNIRRGDPWQGLADKQPDRAFATFVSDAYGIRALAVTLITYQDKYGLHTIRGVISRWAPPSENNTEAYIQDVAKQTGFGADDSLDLHTYADLRPLVEAIIRHENGNGPLTTANTWYDEATISTGLSRAGIEPPRRAAGPVPVTKETVGATSTGIIGVAQLADIAPKLVDALTNQQDHLTSGNIAQIVLGAALVGLAVFIAWSQVSKHKAGVL